MREPTITLHNADCLPAMREMEDNRFELAIVDPPYGININMNMGRKKGMPKKHIDKQWDCGVPTEEYFAELFRVSQNQIIWGGNYFDIPPCRHFVFWDKLVAPGMSFSDGEFAWTSFDMAIKKYTLQSIQDDRIHPTQKPVALYKWLLKNYATPGDTILDTHLGSGSIAIACHDYGFDLVGYELDSDYYAAAVKRLDDHRAQMRLNL